MTDRRKKKRKMTTQQLVITFVAIFAASIAFAVVGYKVLTYYTGPILFDEWTCSEGEAPVNMSTGGSYCAKVGSKLPAGEEWDRLGNRPAECSSRHGWREIENTSTGETDCLSTGGAVPSVPPLGWEFTGFRTMT